MFLGERDPVAGPDLFGKVPVGHGVTEHRDDALGQARGVGDLLFAVPGGHRGRRDDEKECIRLLDGRPDRAGKTSASEIPTVSTHADLPFSSSDAAILWTNSVSVREYEMNTSDMGQPTWAWVVRRRRGSGSLPANGPGFHGPEARTAPAPPASMSVTRTTGPPGC